MYCPTVTTIKLGRECGLLVGPEPWYPPPLGSGLLPAEGIVDEMRLSVPVGQRYSVNRLARGGTSGPWRRRVLRQSASD
jgi:hypothetical protein